MNMLKRPLAALLCALCLLSLTACHGTLRSRDEGLSAAAEAALYTLPEEFDASRSYEITFWAKSDNNKVQTAIYESAIRSFEELYPNVRVRLKQYFDYGRIYQDVITNIATDTTPNVCITYPDHIATYLTGEDTVVPLDGLIADGRYGLAGSELRFDSPRADEIIPQFLREGKIGGVQYAIPYMRSTEACYVNKTMVEKLGYTLPETLTWDFVWEVSEAALERADDGTFALNGQKVMKPFMYKSSDNMMIQMLRQLDAPYSTPGGEVLIFSDTTRSLLHTVSEHAAHGAFTTFKHDSYPGNFFNAGQCLFAIDSTAGATWMGSDAPLMDISADNVVSFETEVMMIPQFDVDNPQMISQGPSICVFRKSDPQEVLAAWLFAQYLLTNEVQIAYAETEGYVPVTAKAQQSAEYRDYLERCGEDNELHYDVKIKAARLLLENVEHTFTTPVFNGSASLRSAAGALIDDVTIAPRRKKTVDEAYLDKLFADVTSLNRLDMITVTADADSDGNGGAAAEAEEGPLPRAAVALLASLGAAWTLIGACALSQRIGEKKKDKA